jgi:hypothetical protein
VCAFEGLNYVIYLFLKYFKVNRRALKGEDLDQDGWKM